jgi:hypothetical protein
MGHGHDKRATLEQLGRHEALSVVWLALERGYLDELFENREARDSFKDDVLGIQIGGIADEVRGSVVLSDGSTSQVIPLPERTP